jgi:lipoate-protein ligase A
MQYLDYTGRNAVEDLAVDEALLDDAETGNEPRELLRIWECRETAAIIGRSSSLSVEVKIDECRRRGVSVLRRSSGGATVVIGPGCLMYSVVLSYARRPHLRAVDLTHQFVLDTVLSAVRRQEPTAERCGTSDLAIAGRKFSGNSLRCRREHLLYHGTLLYEFPLAEVGELLGTPPRQPDYRERREHGAFITNVKFDRAALIADLRRAWQADEVMPTPPLETAARLAAERYGDPAWTARVP